MGQYQLTQVGKVTSLGFIPQKLGNQHNCSNTAYSALFQPQPITSNTSKIRYLKTMVPMTKVLCERMDCKHWIDGECGLEQIKIKERTISADDELAICSNYKILPAYC